jgi:hypothetical protein
MNPTVRLRGRPRWARLPSARTAAAFIATAAIAFPAAAFGGTPPLIARGGSSIARASALSRSFSVQKALAYSRCMRRHGEPGFPDPSSSGRIDLAGTGVDQNSPQYRSAANACKALSPFTVSQAQQTQQWNRDLAMARCMRSHGFPSFPDPTRGPTGAPIFQIGRNDGINPKSPRFERAQSLCEGAQSGGNSGD